MTYGLVVFGIASEQMMIFFFLVFLRIQLWPKSFCSASLNGRGQFVHFNVADITEDNSSTLKWNYFSMIKQNFLRWNSHYAWTDILNDEYIVPLIINLTLAQM